MFNQLTNRLTDVFIRLGKKGALTEADVDAALREVRIALLEADVALPVVKDFIEKARAEAVGQNVIKSIKPDQQVIKIVHDTLVGMLGEAVPLDFNAAPPVTFLMLGLQGSGKTTTSAKLGRWLQQTQKKRVLMASLDTQRPAAQEQLRILGEQADVPTLPIMAGQSPTEIAKRAQAEARSGGFDVLILDTAGRLVIDAPLMAELAAVRDIAKPQESLLVADAMTGQDAVNTATAFHEQIGLTGIILTRIDGDGRGGAALSMRSVTGQPIKMVGTGEKLDALEVFYPDRIAGRILDKGDIVSLVEKAATQIDQADAEKLARRALSGQFTLEDLSSQLGQLRKMGGLSSIVNLLPGMGKINDMMKEAKVDDKMIARQQAIISSMTVRERQEPDIIKAKRKQRIAAGSGVTVQEVNKMLQQYMQMRDMMKQVKKMGGAKGLMKGGLGQLMGGRR